MEALQEASSQFHALLRIRVGEVDDLERGGQLRLRGFRNQFDRVVMKLSVPQVIESDQHFASVSWVAFLSCIFAEFIKVRIVVGYKLPSGWKRLSAAILKEVPNDFWFELR
ncbi:hypothetical protein [Roseibacillus persicicus]|uniref:hypothetical protein n=1 Tax=Roseibacillus persicicus TaxID=454148 RepID=UPI002810290D|nr:hypothetical protein [Roseibacillus persicicus]MDQ8191693.1 hypothetical protein [Roseibacillus persicicus]